MLSISQMHEQFRIEYDSIDSFSNPEYKAEEVDYFLNTAQDNLILLAKKDGIESTQTYRDMLANITENFSTSTFVATSDNEPNGVFVQLPSNYRTSLKEAVTVTYANCNSVDATKRLPVVPTTHDRLNVDTRNPFKRPNKNERVLSIPFKYLTGDPSIQSVELLTDGTFSITNYYLRYFKNPRAMQYGTIYSTPTADVDCELNLEAQNWIIAEAAKLAFITTNQLQKVQVLTQLDKSKG